MGPPDNNSIISAPEALDCLQAPSPSERVRPLDVEALIREARGAGYDGPQRRLVRLIRAYIEARETEPFAIYLRGRGRRHRRVSDPTPAAAVRQQDGSGWAE